MERMRQTPPQSVEQAREPKSSGKIVRVENRKLGRLITEIAFAEWYAEVNG